MWLSSEPPHLYVNAETPWKLPCDETSPVTHTRGNTYATWGAEARARAGKIIKLQLHQWRKLQNLWASIRVKSSNYSSGGARWQRIREERLPGLFEESTPSLSGSPVCWPLIDLGKTFSHFLLHHVGMQRRQQVNRIQKKCCKDFLFSCMKSFYNYR